MPADHDLPYLLADVTHQLQQRLAAGLAPLSLTVRQFGVLDSLRSAPDTSAADLARRSLLSRQTMNGLLRQLENLDAVGRTGRTGGRAIGLQLTDRGRALHERARRVADEIEHGALSWLPDGDRRHLGELLVSIRDQLARPGPRT